MYHFSGAVCACDGNYIKITRRKGDSDETTTGHIAVMNDVTVLAKGIGDAKSVLERIEAVQQ